MGKATLGMLCAAALSLLASQPAQAAFDDPLFVMTPKLPQKIGETPILPSPWYLEGPCGLAVDSNGRFYVSDYYHEAIDAFSATFDAAKGKYKFVYGGQQGSSGPCGLALDSKDNLYVNVFHASVRRLSAPVALIDSSYSTGVAVDRATNHVYANDRTYVAVYDSSGAPVLDEGAPLRIGEGSIEDGYGLAVSEQPATKGRVFIADAADGTVKAYDPATDEDNPAMTIAGPAGGQFVSLRDSALAVDRVTGNLYVADNRQPKYAEHPEATIYVFGPSGNYLGRLKHNIVDARPPGLAVDNSATSTQGRVYVTSGNTIEASVIAYPPGAQTSVSLPPIESSEGASGSDVVSLAGDEEKKDCPDACGSGSNFSSKPQPEATTSEVTQRGSLRLSVNGKLSPKKLPRKGVAPISVSVGWNASTTDGSPLPKLKKIRIEINRHGRFEQTGLPTCPYNRIQPASSSRALANCREALVGQGSFSADIALKGQEPYATKGRLLVFNGEKGGKPVLFGQIYSPYPFATSFVIVFKVQKLGKGTYGTALSATLPKALASWGNLTGIEMKLSRRYSYNGKPHSYISAGCPAPKGFRSAVFPLARASFGFAGEGELSSTLTSTCQAKG